MCICCHVFTLSSGYVYIDKGTYCVHAVVYIHVFTRCRRGMCTLISVRIVLMLSCTYMCSHAIVVGYVYMLSSRCDCGVCLHTCSRYTGMCVYISVHVVFTPSWWGMKCICLHAVMVGSVHVLCSRCRGGTCNLELFTDSRDVPADRIEGSVPGSNRVCDVKRLTTIESPYGLRARLLYDHVASGSA